MSLIKDLCYVLERIIGVIRNIRNVPTCDIIYCGISQRATAILFKNQKKAAIVLSIVFENNMTTKTVFSNLEIHVYKIGDEEPIIFKGLDETIYKNNFPSTKSFSTISMNPGPDEKDNRIIKFLLPNQDLQFNEGKYVLHLMGKVKMKRRKLYEFEINLSDENIRCIRSTPDKYWLFWV